MKAKIISMFIVLLLCISTTGCSVTNSSLKSNNTNITPTTKTSTTNVHKSQTTTSSSSKSVTTKSQTQMLHISPVLETYKAVLQNKIKFFDTYNKRNFYLNYFLASNSKENNTGAFKITQFTVLA